MTTRILSTCDGVDICLEVDEVTLVAMPSARTGFYRYRCPHCGRNASGFADQRITSQLRAVGVPTEEPDLTAAEVDAWLPRLESVSTIDELAAT